MAMEVLHAVTVVIFNGVLVSGEFLLREAAPLLGGLIAIVFTRIEIREHAEIARGIEGDELLP
jgi:hypothetical protein